MTSPAPAATAAAHVEPALQSRSFDLCVTVVTTGNATELMLACCALLDRTPGVTVLGQFVRENGPRVPSRGRADPP